MIPKAQSDIHSRLVLEKLHNHFAKGDIAVLCGAGISVESGLPTAGALVDEILQRIRIDWSDFMLADGKTWKIPFEAFIQTLQETSDISSILNIFKRGKPTRNHLAIAKLALAGKLRTIVTTNFDCLLERAFESFGARRGSDFQVFHREEDFKTINWSSGTPRLIKIHGSIEEPDRIAATLRFVAARRLSESRARVIEHLFSSGDHRHVLILGYSCNDVFDISPQIESIKTPSKTVTYIEYGERLRIRADPLKEEMPSPFGRFKNSYKIFGTSGRILSNAVSRVLAKTLRKQRDNVIDWKTNIGSWAKELSPRMNYYHARGMLYETLSLPEKSLVAFQTARKHCKRNSPKLGRILLNIASILSDSGRYTDAKGLYAKTLDLPEIDEKTRTSVHYGLAILQRAQGEFLNAYQSIKSSLKLAEKLKWTHCIIRSLQVKADVLADQEKHEDAQATLEMGRTLAEGNGYIHEHIAFLMRMGNGASAMGDGNKAMSFFKQAETLSIKTGHQKLQASAYSNIGALYFQVGHTNHHSGNSEKANKCYNLAIEAHTRAQRIYEEQNDKNGIAQELVSLASVKQFSTRAKECEADFERAQKIFEAIGRPGQAVDTLCNLATFHLYQKNNDKAIKLHKEALSKAQHLEGKRRLATIKGNLAIPLALNGNYDEAEKHLKEAVLELKKLVPNGQRDWQAERFEKDLERVQELRFEASR